MLVLGEQPRPATSTESAPLLSRLVSSCLIPPPASHVFLSFTLRKQTSPSFPLGGLLVARGGGPGVPGLDDPGLRGVDVALVLDVLDADLHAVLGEDDVVRGEAVLGVGADLGRAHVHVVAHEADAGHHEE